MELELWLWYEKVTRLPKVLLAGVGTTALYECSILAHQVPLNRVGLSSSEEFTGITATRQHGNAFRRLRHLSFLSSSWTMGTSSIGAIFRGF